MVVAAAVGLLASACVGPLSSDEDQSGALGSEPADGDASDGENIADQDEGEPTEDAAGDDDTDRPPDLPGGPGVVGPTPTFAEGACAFDVPLDTSPRCGTVTVPSNWQTGDGTVELAVAVFESTADSPAQDPVVYLEGGPGSHALDTVRFVVEDFLEPLQARGDVIFFDQRGTGFSQPQLGCPESTELSRRLEDDPSVDDDRSIELRHEALAACRARLIDEGVTLTDYNSINNAHDVEALRIALGYDQWNLFGISYGTKLGLEVLRRHPDGVRSAVLDSVYPPQVDSVLENPNSFLESYQRVVAACAEEPACAVDGDLGERIAALVARYDAEPVQVEIRDWISDETDQVFVTGDSIVGIIIGALYSPFQFTDIPELVSDLEAGRTGSVIQFLGQDRTTERFFSTGMFYAFACNEEISFADPDDVAAEVPPDPFGQQDRFDFGSNIGNLAFGTCQAFDNGLAPATSNTAVTSDVPTLLMAGEFDPVTPVSWAERAAETLTNSSVVVAPLDSHGVSGSQCGMSIALDFLERTGEEPDSSCFQDETLVFLASPEVVELESVSYQVAGDGIGLDTVRPVDWSVGSLEGDQYRQASFLDPTEFYQLAGDERLSVLLVDFIETQRQITLSAPEPFVSDAAVPFDAGALDRTWIRRTGQGNGVAVEWFETEIDGALVLVALVSTPEEVGSQLESVVLPALQQISVQIP